MPVGYKGKVMGHLFWGYISKMPCIQLREYPLRLAKNGVVLPQKVGTQLLQVPLTSPWMQRRTGPGPEPSYFCIISCH